MISNSNSLAHHLTNNETAIGNSWWLFNKELVNHLESESVIVHVLQIRVAYRFVNWFIVKANVHGVHVWQIGGN